VEVTRDDLVTFQRSLLRLSEMLTQGPFSAPEYRAIIGTALEQTEDYGRRMTRIVKLQSAELCRIVDMLAQAITAISAANTKDIENLQSIAKRIETTKHVDDLRMMKAQLSDCLNLLQEETVRKRSEAVAVLGRMKQELARTAERIGPNTASRPPRDPLTGFPARAEAEACLAKALESSPNVAAAVFVIQRLPQINSRFGYSTGDEVLKSFAGYLRERVASADRLFRWSGPAFVVIIERHVKADDVHREFAPISARWVEDALPCGVRSTIPVSSAWSFFESTKKVMCGEMIKKIDQFIETCTTSDRSS
jgi:diguanylate cyclase (GGDEF)-like protein